MSCDIFKTSLCNEARVLNKSSENLNRTFPLIRCRNLPEGVWVIYYVVASITAQHV
jgi:hypothetical protein